MVPLTKLIMNYELLKKGLSGDSPFFQRLLFLHRGDLSGQVVLPLFDAFTALEAAELHNVQLSAGSLGDFAHQALDVLIGILDEGLLQQAHFLVVLLDPALDHPVDDLLGLAFVQGLGAKDFLLFFQLARVHFLTADSLGLGRGNLQRQVVGKGLYGFTGTAGSIRCDFNQDANLAAQVDIGGNHAGGLITAETADGDLFPDRDGRVAALHR